MKKYLAIVCLLLVKTVASAQDQQALADTADVAEMSVEQLETDSIAAFSSQTEIPMSLVPDTVMLLPQDDALFSLVPDSVLVERLQALSSPIPLTFNPQVRRFIELYVVKRRDQLARMLALSEYYFPMFEQIMDAQGMPLELKYMAIIESALNPRALSRVGASGIYQFMYYTGKRFGLEVTSYVDERRDAYKATVAAAKYMKELYDTWGDWHLAIAAYNCGPGNVRRAIARSGGKRTFWEIYYHLPRETRGYVPAFIAAAYTLNYAHLHGITADASFRLTVNGVSTIDADTVMVFQPLHLQQVSAVTGVDLTLLRDLNTAYKHDVVPAVAGGKQYPLRMPVEYTERFAALEDSVYRFNREKYFPDNKIVPISDAVYGQAMPGSGVHLVYRVKQGDVPGAIAAKFGVRLADLKYWNGMRRNIIRVGQKLHIYVPKNKADKFKDYIAK